MSKFTDYNFKSYIQASLDELGFVETTEVQQRLIPLVMKGKSIVGESQTGSGKTHTFLLPIFEKLDVEADAVQAVITAPSRELATQIYQAAVQIASKSDVEIRVVNYVGGTDKARQIKKLEAAQPHIVIGTPGRILDLINEKALDIHLAKTMVIDEADMTLDAGFLDDVDKIAALLNKDVQLLVFSATIPEKLKPFFKKYLNNPIIEKIENKHVISETIDNWLIYTKNRNVNQYIYELLTIGHPYLAFVFANTKSRVDEIASYLQAQGLKVAKIHGGIQARERKRIMTQVKNLEYQFVVASDLAARGIDIDGVSHIINAEIPNDLEFFIHRVGRSGRKGAPGIAITLYDDSSVKQIAEIEKMGVEFHPKDIKNGEIVDVKSRTARTDRAKHKNELNEIDLTTRGAIAKAKKKVKPGYKKKIGWDVEKRAKAKRKVDRRADSRQARKHKKSSMN
ncbi:MAG: DEAD/DEAH box helicase [Lactobacillales bacterium]|jgi:ATP-dependent RNA helicase CshB|nr:DEAD/DEAH box helicase [Lactobacillales bacterium]